MANTIQARKRSRQSIKQKERNNSLRSKLRTAIKSVRSTIHSQEKESVLKTYQSAQAIIDKISNKKIIHRNTASRIKSRLSVAIKKSFISKKEF